jgi:Ca2+:H+ antiporter
VSPGRIGDRSGSTVRAGTPWIFRVMVTLSLEARGVKPPAMAFSTVMFEADSGALPEEVRTSAHSTSFHVACLVLTLLPAVYPTEELGHIVEHAVTVVSAPAGLAGVAVLVLAPEAMGELQAALRNRLQRAVNIALGSVLATIGLTVPAVLVSAC